MFHKMLGNDIIALDRFMIESNIKSGESIPQTVCQIEEDCNMLDGIELGLSQIAIISIVISFMLDVIDEVESDTFELIVGEDFTIIKFI